MYKKIICLCVFVFIMHIFAPTEALLSKNSDTLKIQNQFLGYIHKKKYEEAIYLANESLKKFPNWHEMYNNRGLVYKMMGKYDLALKDFEKSLSINPNYAVAHQSIGVLHYELGDIDEALKCLEKAIEDHGGVKWKN